MFTLCPGLHMQVHVCIWVCGRSCVHARAHAHMRACARACLLLRMYEDVISSPCTSGDIVKVWLREAGICALPLLHGTLEHKACQVRSPAAGRLLGSEVAHSHDGAALLAAWKALLSP